MAGGVEGVGTGIGMQNEKRLFSKTKLTTKKMYAERFKGTILLKILFLLGLAPGFCQLLQSQKKCNISLLRKHS